jgi:uncharacterized membrane protein
VGGAGVVSAQPSYVYTTVDVPGASGTFASGINDAGQIVGFYGVAFTAGYSFLLSGSSYTTLDTPGQPHSRAWGINNLGQIVGEYIDACNQTRGYLLSEGRYTAIDFPGSSLTVANGLNATGQIFLARILPECWESTIGARSWVTTLIPRVSTAFSPPPSPSPLPYCCSPSARLA